MARHIKKIVTGQRLFVGIDLHNHRWHITIISSDTELFSGSIPGTWEALRRLLDRYRQNSIQAVYEAGYFGYWLHDRLSDYGIECIVTPPSLVPMEYGNRVKTDKRDSRKLAYLFAKGLLKRVWVPNEEERYHRQVGRRRRQLVNDRNRTQNRIKAELRFYGIDMGKQKSYWTDIYFENLQRIRFKNRWMQESFNRLLEQYEFLSGQIKKQTSLLKELAKSSLYQERVKILTSIPGVGILGAMELLLELQDISRFCRADQLAAYVGLTPSQYSSGDKTRMGRITGTGKKSVRCALVESSWWLIRKDKIMREKFERIKARAGAKRAIVAIARTLLLRARRLLLDGTHYTLNFGTLS